MEQETQTPHKRRVRYKGKYPKKFEEKYKELKNCAVQAGDILISLVGTYGKTLIMPDNYEAGIINPRLMKITLNKNKVTPIYFKYYFESNALKASMDANTHGGTMGILNLGIIRQMKIQVPPLSLQNQFAAFVERVDQQKQTVQQSLEKLELMKKAASYLVGKHDFRSFCGNNKMKKSTVRTIYDVDIVKEGDYVRMRFHGNGFLQNMVRILTGTLVEVGYGNMSAEHIPEIIAGMDRQLAGPTAPPHGLCLMKVEYD